MHRYTQQKSMFVTWIRATKFSLHDLGNASKSLFIRSSKFSVPLYDKHIIKGCKHL